MSTTDADASAGDGEAQARLDNALRSAATDAEGIEDLVAAVVAETAVDPREVRARAYQLGFAEPDWPSHVDREAVIAAAEQSDTPLELARRLRTQRRTAQSWARWCGVADEIEPLSLAAVGRAPDQPAEDGGERR